MPMRETDFTGGVPVDGYGPGFFRVAGQVHRGAVIVAGVFTFLIAPVFVRLLTFFPPVVTGTVITVIGISLLPMILGLIKSRRAAVQSGV